jgi:hypothetical protein
MCKGPEAGQNQQLTSQATFLTKKVNLDQKTQTGYGRFHDKHQGKLLVEVIDG